MAGGSLRRRLRLSYFFPFVALAILALLIVWRVQSEESVEYWVQHTYDVMLSVMNAESDLSAVKINLRSYLLEPKSEYLQKLHAAEDRLTVATDRLFTLVSDNPVQQRRLLDLSGLLGRWNTEVNALLSNGGKNFNAQQFEQVEDRGRQLREVLDQMSATERDLLQRRNADRARRERAILTLVPILSILLAAALSYFGWRQIILASGDLERALASSEDANRLKDNFLATVSHELRNPLNTILLRCHLLAEEEHLSNKARLSVQSMERAAKAQAQLIEDLLDISRIESGRLRLDVQTTDLVDVVQSAVEAMRVAADAKSISLVETIDPRVTPIAGDPHRLQQVVWNLVSNAVKFTPKGGRIQVRLERINSHVEIIVADNGKGIEPASLPLVFDRFWQAPGADRVEVGVGLGLSIARQLVTMHGGTIVAHSDGFGKGATFTVRLPLPVSTAPVSEQPRRHPTVAPMTRTGELSRLDGLYIVVADDDESACGALKELLGSLGAKVDTAQSVDDALRLIDGMDPDVIVSDIGMPGRDGLSLAQEIRKRERESARDFRVPLIALTAYGRVEDRVQILSSGFDSHVVKPVELSELSAIISSLTARLRTRARAELVKTPA
ncbi:MAG TPA: ATP-binding protein [Candidatus Binataceae bacterium]|nr:ATP-binding protein [Candidatus Binataceae bacterium]